MDKDHKNYLSQDVMLSVLVPLKKKLFSR